MCFIETQHYEFEISSIQKELKKLPAGYLVRRGTYYFQRTPKSEKGITKKKQVVQQLARKAYLLKRLDHLKHNLELVKKQKPRYKTEDPKSIIKHLSPPYQMLPKEYFFHMSVFDWAKKPFEENPAYAEELIYLTNSGLCVRSKSERTIANALDQNEIPYQYEVAFFLGNQSRYPDFTIKRPADGKVFLWEHFGLMDQSAYQQKAIEKLSLYAQHGFFPFENLICSYEKDLRDVKQIQTLIEFFLL